MYIENLQYDLVSALKYCNVFKLIGIEFRFYLKSASRIKFFLNPAHRLILLD
jgi:putative effector of murein hydrolase